MFLAATNHNGIYCLFLIAQAETFGVELSTATVREAIKLFLQHSRTGPLRKVTDKRYSTDTSQYCNMLAAV
jgi:hypothetical protein